jgi:hypothetical protein
VRGGRGENKVPKKKTEIRDKKGQRKKVKLGWQRDRKENPMSVPSIHVGALVGAASLWLNPLTKPISLTPLVCFQWYIVPVSFASCSSLLAHCSVSFA